MAPFGDYQQHGQLMLQESAATSMVDGSLLAVLGSFAIIAIFGGVLAFMVFNNNDDVETLEKEMDKLEKQVNDLSTNNQTPGNVGGSWIVDALGVKNFYFSPHSSIDCVNGTPTKIPAEPVVTGIVNTSDNNHCDQVELDAGTQEGQIKIVYYKAATHANPGKQINLSKGSWGGETWPAALKLGGASTKLIGSNVTFIWLNGKWEILSENQEAVGAAR